ncbi:vWA domain-containing protein [Streptomyces kutzneri]|uniref:vWA domain-containing protein n=1 Tax=Streptomyces kutzneri TaxID=3051179 RepID=UPI0028D5934A|nr:hypothetical protein [Streptomyces sp. DSM 40907]
MARPWGPIRPASPQALKLAEFLRARVDESQKTLAVLAKDISLSKSQVGVYLSGKIPPQAFVTAIVNATVPAPLRERRHSEAGALLRDALHPPRPDRRTTGGAVAGDSMELARLQARQIETYDRLTRSLEQQAEIRRTADNSAKLVMVLLGMIHTLQTRVTGLAEERDHLAQAERGVALEAAQRKLSRAEAQKEKARRELELAEEKRRQAEELADRLQARIEELTEDLDRMRGDQPSPHDHLPDLAGAVPLAPGVVPEDPEGDDVDDALAHVSVINENDAATIDRITTELDDTGLTISDNSPTSTDASDNLRAEKARASPSAEAGRGGHDGDAATARDLYGAQAAGSTVVSGLPFTEDGATAQDHDPRTARMYRPVQFIWLLDCSRSMAGEKTGQLNYAIREFIPEMRALSSENPDIGLEMRVGTFGSGARWQTAAVDIKQAKWPGIDFQSSAGDGACDMGAAFRLAARALRVPPMPLQAPPPVLALVSGAPPTDDWRSGLRALAASEWGNQAVRIAIGVGAGADRGVLQEFLQNPELQPLDANSPKQAAAAVRWAEAVAGLATDHDDVW